MLFYIGWKGREGLGPEGDEAGWALFGRWEPPEGMEVKGMWARPDGGGFCVCEASSAEVIYEGVAPWSGVYLDYDIVPIVEIEKAHDLSKGAIAFRKG